MRGKKACDPCRYGSCRGPVLIGYFGVRPSTRLNLARITSHRITEEYVIYYASIQPNLVDVIRSPSAIVSLCL
jgi:hypothetical protein